MTTIHSAGDDYPPDLLDRDFTSSQPGTRLVGDITYLRTGQGWLHLATVIDFATRMVVGWQITDHMRTSLVIDTLRWLGCSGIGARLSMGRTGVCWDNAVAESFFATLKNEMPSPAPLHHQSTGTVRCR